MLWVPNVPCGVESSYKSLAVSEGLAVPNVPCGVERPLFSIIPKREEGVPNVPCGVESFPRKGGKPFSLRLSS